MPRTGFSLSESAIRRPVTTIVASLLIITAGIASLQSIPIRELPDVDSSVVTVTTCRRGDSRFSRRARGWPRNTLVLLNMTLVFREQRLSLCLLF